MGGVDARVASLLGPLKLNGKQTGWIYATFPLACIFAPLVAWATWPTSVQRGVDHSVLPRYRRRLAICRGEQTKFRGMFCVDAGLLDLLHGHAAAD